MKLNHFYCGNNLDILRDFPSESIDMTLTSPPYDNLRTYGGYTFDFEGVAQELFRLTRPGRVVVWIVNDETKDGDESGTSFRQALYFKEIGFKLHDTMIWKKPNFSNPANNRYHQVFEYMFVLSKGAPTVFNPIKDVKNKYRSTLGRNTTRESDGTMRLQKKRDFGEWGMRHNVWHINTSGQELMCQHIDHPATFSQELAKDHILSWSNEGDVILDPFMGSGTTALMALVTGRQFIGCEINPEYVHLSECRIEKEAGLLWYAAQRRATP